MERFHVLVAPDLEPIMGRYMEIRRTELEELLLSIATEDRDTVLILGHRLKGSGTSYGMEGLTKLGESIEEAARAGDFTTASAMAGLVREYLDAVNIIYQEPEAS